MLADRPAVLALLAKLPVETWRRDLEVIPSLDQRGRIEHVAELSAQAFAIPDAHTARLVHVEPQHPARPEPAPLEVDELEPVIAHHRYDHPFDQDRPFRLIHPRSTLAGPKLKKAGGGPLFRDFSTSSARRQAIGMLLWRSRAGHR